jgi:phage gp46-like protein
MSSDYGLFLDSYGVIDIKLLTGDVAPDDGLETAVLISLFSDARANEDQIAAIDRDGDLRGFWGDLQGPDKTGSLLWTIKRAKQLASVLAAARSYAAASLQWLVDDLVADRVEVRTSYPSRGWMLLEVFIYRPGASNPVVFRYNYEWAAQIIKVAS